MPEGDAATLNPWLSMWVRPRRTVRQIIDTDPRRLLVLLGMIAAIATAIDRTSAKSMGDKYPLWAIVGIPILLSPLTGLVYIYVYGALLRWTGRWIGGQATPAAMRAAVAWPHVITAWTLPLWIPLLALYGREMFTSHTPVMDANPGPLLVIWLVDLVAICWFAVVFLKSVGEAHGFSAWKALANVVIAAAVLVAAVLAIVIPIVLLAMIAV